MERLSQVTLVVIFLCTMMSGGGEAHPPYIAGQQPCLDDDPQHLIYLGRSECGKKNPFSVEENNDNNRQLLEKIICQHGNQRVIKFFVDLREDKRVFKPGRCPSPKSTVSEDEVETPLTFVLSKNRYGKAYLAFALNNVQIFSLTSFSRYSAISRKPHLQVQATDPCWRNLSYDHRSTYLAEAVYTRFLNNSQKLLRTNASGDISNVTRTVCKSALRWTDVDRGLDNFELCFRHPITILRKKSLLATTADWAWVHRCCTIRKNDQIRCQVDLCGDNYLVLAHVLADVFFILAFIIIFPLFPLKIMSEMLKEVLHPFVERENQPSSEAVADYVFLESEQTTRNSLHEASLSLRSHPWFSMRSDFHLDASLPVCFTATSVWPYLGLLFSKAVIGALVLAMYTCVFIALPFFQYFYVDRKVVYNEDTTDSCQESKDTLNVAVFLTANAVLLYFPFVYLLGHIIYERSIPSRQASVEVRVSNRRRREQWEQLKAMVDGTLHPQPLTKLMRAAGFIVENFLATILCQYPLSVKDHTVWIFGEVRRIMHGKYILAAFCANLALPCFAVALLGIAVVKATLNLVLDVTNLAVILMQLLPLLRLVNSVFFSISGPLLGINCSILVLFCGLVIIWPFAFAQWLVCQQVLSYIFSTAIGLALNYSQEVIVWGSILSTMVIEVHRGYKKLYAPLLSLKGQVVCVALGCQCDRQDKRLRKRLEQCLGEQNTARSFASTESDRHGTEGDFLLRQAALLTFFEMSNTLLTAHWCKENLAFERWPSLRCAQWRQTLQTRCLQRLDNILVPIRRSAGAASTERQSTNRFSYTRHHNSGNTIPLEEMYAGDRIEEPSVKDKEEMLKDYMRERVVSGVKKGLTSFILLIAMLCVLLEFGVFWESQGQLMRIMPLLIPVIECIRVMQQRPQASSGIKRNNIRISRIFMRHLDRLETLYRNDLNQNNGSAPTQSFTANAL